LVFDGIVVARRAVSSAGCACCGDPSLPRWLSESCCLFNVLVAFMSVPAGSRLRCWARAVLGHVLFFEGVFCSIPIVFFRVSPRVRNIKACVWGETDSLSVCGVDLMPGSLRYRGPRCCGALLLFRQVGSGVVPRCALGLWCFCCALLCLQVLRVFFCRGHGVCVGCFGGVAVVYGSSVLVCDNSLCSVSPVSSQSFGSVPVC